MLSYRQTAEVSSPMTVESGAFQVPYPVRGVQTTGTKQLMTNTCPLVEWFDRFATLWFQGLLLSGSLPKFSNRSSIRTIVAFQVGNLSGTLPQAHEIPELKHLAVCQPRPDDVYIWLAVKVVPG